MAAISIVSNPVDFALSLIETPVASEVIHLIDPKKAWIIVEGKLDLFLSAWSEDQAIGARRPLMRLDTGALVTGLRPHNGVAVIAQAAPGTKLMRFSSRFLDGPMSNGISLLDAWVCGLAEALGAATPPYCSPVSIGEGESVVVGESKKLISAKSRIAWISHRSGESKFLGEYSIGSSSDLFPLARQCWMVAGAGTETYAAHMSEVHSLDPEWNGLHRFCAIALDILSKRFHDAPRLERLRVQAKLESDRLLLDRSVQRLSKPVNKSVRIAEGDDNCSHPVFLACKMLGSHMGIRIRPHPDLSRNIPVKDPVSAIARSSNIRVRRVTLKGEWWKSESGGILAFLQETNEPVAILSARKGLEVYNPADNSIRKVTAALAEKFNPAAYAMYAPFPAFSLKPRDLANFTLKDTQAELWFIVIAGIASGLLAMLVPYATGMIFDQFIPGADRPALIQMCGFMVVAAIAISLLGLARGYAVLRMQGKTDAKLQAAVWDRLLSLPVSFFRDYSSGDLAQRSMGISKIREILTGTTLNAILSGIFSIFSYVMLFWYSWKLALVATALVILAGGLTVGFGLACLVKQRQSTQLEGKILSTLLQFVTGISKFRVSATESRAFASWSRQFAALKEISTATRHLTNRLGIMAAVYPLFCTGLFFVFYTNCPSVSDGLTTGDLVAFLAAYGQFLASVLTLSSSAVGALAVIPLFERALPILTSVPEVVESKTTPGRLNGAIELSHINFRYKVDTPQVLRDVSLRIAPGEFVAFVGASGSGKSTLFRLLLGFETPESGAIYFDGQDLAGLDIQSVRSQIGVVLQTSKPVAGSIFENIVGSAPLTLDDAWDAARAAGLDADVRKMAMGMHTHIADGGAGISGGQRQRLLIARAIVARPRILFFDEATSALDNRTQQIVTKSLDALQATRVVIAHRLSTIINADRIFVLEKGCIAQSGTYSELMQQPGLFRSLAERQTV